MAKREYTLPIDTLLVREALQASCNLIKRSQIDDMLFRRPDGIMARLRRQDTVTRLSCTHPHAFADVPETIVLDHAASRRFLELLGFEVADRVRFKRETWRYCQYQMHLDQTDALGDYLTIEAEAGTATHEQYRRQALKQLKSLGISALEPRNHPVDKPDLDGVDSSINLPYTAPIVPDHSKRFEPQGT